MYATGGLEPSDTPDGTYQIDGVNYMLSEKFKSQLRNSIIDWGTFLEIYHNNIYFNFFSSIRFRTELSRYVQLVLSKVPQYIQN